MRTIIFGAGGAVLLAAVALNSADAARDRPKGYFPVPALKYIRGPFLDFVRGILDAPQARQRGLFNRAYVERILSNPEGELTPKGHSKPWQIALLECWLQTHGI
jgi:asparagine synthase (glutamine-hydrolysing)